MRSCPFCWECLAHGSRSWWGPRTAWRSSCWWWSCWCRGFPGGPHDTSMFTGYVDHVVVIIWNEEVSTFLIKLYFNKYLLLLLKWLIFFLGMSWVEATFPWKEGSEIWQACCRDWRISCCHMIKSSDRMFLGHWRSGTYIDFCREMT